MRKAKSNAMLRGLASTALVLLISATAWGQKMKITGTVIDNTNEPIIGAFLRSRDRRHRQSPAQCICAHSVPRRWRRTR